MGEFAELFVEAGGEYLLRKSMGRAVVFLGNRFLKVLIDFRIQEIVQLKDDISQGQLLEPREITSSQPKPFLISLG